MRKVLSFNPGASIALQKRDLGIIMCANMCINATLSVERSRERGEMMISYFVENSCSYTEK